jgi:hypothetical protein
MSAFEQPPLDLGGVCQRWKNRRHSWRPAGEGGFDPARYRVREMPNDLVHTAKAFVRAHHYSGSCGLIFTCQVVLLVTGLKFWQACKVHPRSCVHAVYADFTCFIAPRVGPRVALGPANRAPSAAGPTRPTAWRGELKAQTIQCPYCRAGQVDSQASSVAAAGDRLTVTWHVLSRGLCTESGLTSGTPCIPAGSPSRTAAR